MINKKPLKAMILAAGLGTRLKPFTDKIPKALFEVNGKTLLEQSVMHLKDHGVRSVIINVHHFAGQIIEYLKENNNFGLEITISDETEQLMDTGGGLVKASWFLENSGPFIVRNVDVISDLDLRRVLNCHQDYGVLATLVIRNRETSRYMLFDEEMCLCGWTNLQTGRKIISRPGAVGTRNLAFSGVQILSPEIFSHIIETGKFSLTDLYLRLSKDHQIKGYLDSESYWMDAGKIG